MNLAIDIELFTSVLVAASCGAVLGMERQLRGKPAGIRTSILICVGTMIFVWLGNSLVGGQTDPTRVIGQVVTGIGFLGAGVILTRDGLVIGMTSAAVVWVLAAVGATIGLQRHGDAIMITLVALLTLLGVRFFEKAFKSLRRGVHALEPHEEEDS